MVRTCGAFRILTSQRASLHKGRALLRHLNFQKWSERGVHMCALNILTSKCALRHNGAHATSKSCPRLADFHTFRLKMERASTSQLPKMVCTWCALNILTSKFAARHNGAHFFNIAIATSKSCPRPAAFSHFSLENGARFDISTSKSGLNVVCIEHFDDEMCFAPQRRALLQHRNRNFQELFDTGSLSHFSLENGARFDISTSKSGLHVVCIEHFDVETCFAPQRRTLLQKHRNRNFQELSETGSFFTLFA